MPEPEKSKSKTDRSCKQTLPEYIFALGQYEACLPVEHPEGQSLLTIGLQGDATNSFTGAFFLSLHDPMVWELMLPADRLFGSDPCKDANLKIQIPLQYRIENAFCENWRSVSEMISSGEITVLWSDGSVGSKAQARYLKELKNKKLAASIRLTVNVNLTSARLILQSMPIPVEDFKKNPALTVNDNVAIILGSRFFNMIELPDSYVNKSGLIPCLPLFFVPDDISEAEFETKSIRGLLEVLTNVIWHKSYTMQEVQQWISDPTKPTRNDKPFKSTVVSNKRSRSKTLTDGKGKKFFAFHFY